MFSHPKKKKEKRKRKRFVLPTQEVQVQSLVWELRYHVPCGAGQKLKKKIDDCNS